MNENKRMSKVLTSLCVLALAISCCISGCEDPKPVPGKVGTSLQHQEKVVAKDWVLHQWLRVAQHKAVRTEYDLLRVKVGLENIKEKDLWCDIQVVFYRGVAEKLRH